MMSPLGHYYNSHHTILFGILLLLLSLLSLITAYSNPIGPWEVLGQDGATPFDDDDNIDYNGMDLSYLEKYWAQTSLAAHGAEIQQDIAAMRAWHTSGGEIPADHFVPLQTRILPGGTCRMFNDPDGDPEVYASDQTSICKDVLGEKVKVYLSPTMKNSTFAQNQFAVDNYENFLGGATVRSNCDLALFTYICHGTYPPCEDYPVNTTDSSGSNTDDTTVTTTTTTNITTVPIALYPCRSTYRPMLYRACPIFTALGFFEHPRYGFVWADDDQCHQGLEMLPRYSERTEVDPITGALVTTTRPTLPPFTCTVPLVTVDPFEYKYSTLLGGVCVIGCPSPQYSKEEYIQRDRIALPLTIISNVVGLLVLISYCVIPLLRQRTFIFIGLATIMIHSVWFSIPYWHQIAQHGMGQGARVLCSSSSTEYTQSNFNCAMNGILYIFFLYSSNLANLFLAWSLVEKICLHQYLRLTPRQELWKTCIMIATCFALPAVAVIVALACKNINGTNIAMLYCFISRERDATDVVDMSLLLGYIIPGIIMGCGYILLLWLLFYLCYVKIRSSVKSPNHSLTFAQVRIFLAVITITTIALAAVMFRDWSDRNQDKLKASLSEYVMCLISNNIRGAHICGLRPEHHVVAGWSYYLLLTMTSRPITHLIGLSLSVDIFHGWCAVLFYYFGISWCEKYAEAGGLALLQKNGKSTHHTNNNNNNQSKSLPSQPGSTAPQSGASTLPLQDGKAPPSSPVGSPDARKKMFGMGRVPPGAMSPRSGSQPSGTLNKSRESSGGGDASHVELQMTYTATHNKDSQHIPPDVLGEDDSADDCDPPPPPSDDDEQDCPPPPDIPNPPSSQDPPCCEIEDTRD